MDTFTDYRKVCAVFSFTFGVHTISKIKSKDEKISTTYYHMFTINAQQCKSAK
jgi:hypothetical protein